MASSKAGAKKGAADPFRDPFVSTPNCSDSTGRLNGGSPLHRPSVRSEVQLLNDSRGVHGICWTASPGSGPQRDDRWADAHGMSRTRRTVCVVCGVDGGRWQACTRHQCPNWPDASADASRWSGAVKQIANATQDLTLLWLCPSWWADIGRAGRSPSHRHGSTTRNGPHVYAPLLPQTAGIRTSGTCRPCSTIIACMVSAEKESRARFDVDASVEPKHRRQVQ